MKKKILLSALLTIVLCMSLITGATFALFTDQAEVSVAVTSGTVDVDAKITGLKTYSFDVEQAAGTFENGGTATLTDEDKVLKLDLMSPGDKATLTVDVTNNSNINVKYRVTALVTGELAQYLTAKATVNGVESELKSGATAWTEVAAGVAIGDILVSIELPEGVGNEAQTKSADITVGIQAVQANGADIYTTAVSSEENLQKALLLGGNVKLDADVALTSTLEIPEGTTAKLDLNGKTITATTRAIRNYGDLTIEGDGTVDVTAATSQAQAIDNYGKLTVNGGTYKGTTALYSYTIRNKGEAVINDATMIGGFGGIGMQAEGKAVINGGNFSVNSDGDVYHVIYLDKKAEVVVNGGSFSGHSGTWAYLIYAAKEAKATINGGSFGDWTSAATKKMWTAGAPDDIAIKGGTWTFDPTEWVALGHKAVLNGASYTIEALPVIEVSTEANLQKAFEIGGDVKLSADVALTAPLEMPAGTTVNLDLNGKTVTTDYQENSTTKHDYAVRNYGELTITNGTINARGVENYAGGVLTVEAGVTINSIDTNGGASIWNYAGGEVIINGGTFTSAENTSGYGAGALNNSGKATVNGGTFESGCWTYAIINSGEMTVNNATVEGANGAIANSGSGILNVYGGSYTTNGIPTTTGHAAYCSGGTLTIYGGEFERNSAVGDSGHTVTANGGDIIINGGTFRGGIAGLMSNYDAANSEIVLNGGTYSANVSTYSGVTINGSVVDNGNSTYTVA